MSISLHRALLLIAAIAILPISLAAQEEMIEGFVSVEVSKMASRDLFVRFSGDTLFLPFQNSCEFLGIISSVSLEGEKISGEFPTGIPFTIDPAKGTAAMSDSTFLFPPDRMRAVGSEIFIHDSLFAAIFGISLSYDPSRLLVTILPDERLPLVQLRRNRERYAGLKGFDTTAEEEMESSIDRQLLGSATLAWMVTGNDRNGRRSSSADLQIGGPFLFGTLNVRGNAYYAPEAVKPVAGSVNSWDWNITFPDNSFLTRLGISSSIWGGTRPHYTLSIGNEPLLPRRDGATYEMIGTTEPNWTVELYEHNELIAVTKADAFGDYSFNIPTHGSGYWKVVSIGPHAEQVVEYRQFLRSRRILPQGEVEYSARATSTSIGPGAPLTGSADIGVGIFPWLSIGGEVRARSSDMTKIAADSITPSVLADLWLGGTTSLGIRYNPMARAFWGTFYTIAPGNINLRISSDSTTIDGSRIGGSASASGQLGPFSLSGSGSYLRTPNGSSIGFRPQVSASVLGISLAAGAQYYRRITWRDAEGEILGYPIESRSLVSTLQAMTTLFNLFSLTARASYDHESHDIDGLSIRTTYRPFRFLGLGLGWSRDRRAGSAFQLSLNVNAGAFQARMGGTYRNDDFEYFITPTFRGAARISPAGLDFSERASMNDAAVIVHAFHDLNGNGEQDGDEEDLDEPRIRLRSHGSSIRKGNGSILSIPAYREYLVEIDRSSFAGEGLFPYISEYRIYTMPSATEVIRVPFAQGNYATGTCEIKLSDGKLVTIGGVLNGLTIRLVATRGTIVCQGEVFPDGSILFEGVLPGDYRIELDNEQLHRRGLDLPTLPTLITLSDTQTTLPHIIFPAKETAPTGNK